MKTGSLFMCQVPALLRAWFFGLINGYLFFFTFGKKEGIIKDRRFLGANGMLDKLQAVYGRYEELCAKS